MEKIFISYKRVDKNKVFSIKQYIEQNIGVKCWIDLDGIESDAQFANVIINAINNAKVVLFMYSSAHSKIVDYNIDWTIKEINFAQKKKKIIIFINIDGTALTDWFEFTFGTKQQVDASSKEAMCKLCEDLKKWLNIMNGSIAIQQSSQKEENNNSELESSYSMGSWFFMTFNDIEKAIEYLEPAAMAGHVKSQNLLGLVLCKKKDFFRALSWFTKASEQGNHDAQYSIGKLHYKGYFGKVNYEEAIKWFTEAANRGNYEAYNMIGLMYEEGKGVNQNYNLAYENYLIAAKNGNAAAQYNIGCLIEQGKLSHYKLDINDAIKWFTLASKQGDKDAEVKLKHLVRDIQ